ncbi:MAG: hypothetical protein MUF83_03505 [Acidimicrobiales bacterium]|nr:hypothetical protein [Acidimicrobiales bacterium]
MGDVDPTRIRAVERWFADRGTPHLIEGYSVTEDVLTRAAIPLALVLVLELTGALQAAWAWWQNLLAGIGAFAVLVGVWAVLNLVRGRAPFVRPERVGWGETLVFVLVPGLVTATIGGQLLQGLALVVGNVVLLALASVVVSYGLIPLTRWALVKAAHELESVGPLLGRALPLLLLITIVLFINTEMWQVADGLSGWFLVAVVGLFFLVGLAFLLTRLPRELDRLATFPDGDAVRAEIAGTPAEPLGALVGPGPVPPGPLSRRQQGNVLLVALFSQGIPVVVVTVVLGAFFVVLGLLTITPEIVQTWLGHPGDVLVSATMLGRQVELTAELVKLATFLAAFSGLYFSVVTVTDATYREEFLDEILAELRQTFAVRSAYLVALRGADEERHPPGP